MNNSVNLGWSVEKLNNDGRDDQYHVNDEKGSLIFIEHRSGIPVTHPDRAILIAAAPELRDAAELGIEYDMLLRKYSGPQSVLLAGDSAEIDAAYDKWIAATRAAIAKATL